MNNLAIDELLHSALMEDIGFGDITSEAVVDSYHTSQGYVIMKQDAILAGMDIFQRVFALLDGRVEVELYCQDGQKVQNGQRIARIEGPTRAILSGERTALNLLQHLTGIATLTNAYVKTVAPYGAMIADTRKTLPGLRMLDKYAVKVGGGKNQRYRLDDMVLIKDNHIKAAGGVINAIAKVKERVSPYVKIEVEVESLEQVEQALMMGADVIMLDNMSADMVQEAVRVINKKALVEASGNIDLERAAKLAACGVDILSVGALTHSVKAADISLRLV